MPYDSASLDMSPMYPFVHLRFAQVFNTLSNDWFLTAPPPMADLTLRLNPSLFDRRSSAASLFKGSAAFGSRKRNYRQNISRPASSLLGRFICLPGARQSQLADSTLASNPL